MAALRKLWELWKAFGIVLGHVQSTILLAIIYHVGVGPVSVIGKVMRVDLMQLRARQGDSHTDAVPPITTTLDKALKQF